MSVYFDYFIHVYVQCIYTSGLLQVERIRLSHDNSGPNPEWYLESLRIEIPSRDEKYMFPCNRWLTGDEDRRVEVEVYPGMVNIITMKLLSWWRDLKALTKSEPKTLYKENRALHFTKIRAGFKNCKRLLLYVFNQINNFLMVLIETIGQKTKSETPRPRSQKFENHKKTRFRDSLKTPLRFRDWNKIF